MFRKLFFILVSILASGFGARSKAAVILSETFSYPDGPLQIVSSNKWVGHSGTTNQVDVANGVLNLTGTESQDVNAALGGQPYTTAILYCSFKTKLTALPSGGGGYFAHFKDAGAGFRARLWALTNGAAGGSFRLGIGSASGTAPTTVLTNDLRPGVEYAIVTRLVVSNSVASLWINPASENDPNVSTESGPAIPIASYALRQATGMGVMTIDNLLVGTAFADVAEAASASSPPPADPGPAISTQPRSPIARLRSLLDSVNYLPTETATVFTVEGIVTTHTNLTVDPDALFYVQDDTAGIAVFWRGGGGAVPKPGDLVRITAPLTHFNGLLELGPNTGNSEHSVSVLSSNNALPTPTPLDFSWQNDPALLETHEGKLMVVSNIFLDLTPPTFQNGGENVMMTNGTGETFILRIDSRTDIGGRPKPATAATIFGVLGQSDSSDPRTSGYQLWPTRFADVVETARPPAIRFTNYLSNLIRPGDLPTNTFTEHALRPGETLTLRVWVSSPDNRDVSLWTNPDALPASASWKLSAASGTNLTATFTFTPTSAEAGSNYVASLQALSGAIAQYSVWKIYVPDPVEQEITVTEFLANPATDPAAAHFNPLRRAEPSPSPSSNDEYIELANLSNADLDLRNWTISDSIQVRHRFTQSFILSSSNALVVYGGPASGFVPALPVAAIPASESSAGLSLNNSGTDSIIVRNAEGHLISRTVYAALSSNGSLTRYPGANDGFTPQTAVATTQVSPGTYPDGRLFGEPLNRASIPLTVTAFRAADASFVIQWNVEPGRTYSVLQSTNINGPFLPLATGLNFADQNGRYLEHRFDDSSPRYYRVSVP